MITVKVDRNATQGSIKRIGVIIENQLVKHDSVSVVIKKFSESKTQRQLALLFGKWNREIADFVGDDVASTHWSLKKNFLHPILMEKREGFLDLVMLLKKEDGNLAETDALYALYQREMSLGKCSKDEVSLYISAIKGFMIHDIGFLGFTDPALEGLV